MSICESIGRKDVTQNYSILNDYNFTVFGLYEDGVYQRMVSLAELKRMTGSEFSKLLAKCIDNGGEASFVVTSQVEIKDL